MAYLDERIAAVREKAELLLGESLGENGDVLTAMTVLWALAYCRREDIPEAMELPLAQLVISTAQSGGSGGVEALGTVKSLTRGDTSITYETGGSSGGSSGGTSAALAGLEPFRRLGRLEKEAGL